MIECPRIVGKRPQTGQGHVKQQLVPIVIFSALLASAVWYAVRSVRRGAAPLNATLAAFNHLTGLITSLLMLVHLVAVTWVGFFRTGESAGWRAEYGFHLYSLWLFGVVTLWQGVSLWLATNGIRRGDPVAIRRAIQRGLILLVVTAPVIPIQHLAAIPASMSVMDLAALGVLIASRRGVLHGPQARATMPS
jgi:hypothetical protein